MLKSAFLITSGVIVAVVWYASPIFKPFPKPTGTYAVGTTVMEFTDPSRQEIYSENSDDKRTVVVRFFYPSFVKTSEGRPADDLVKYPYLGDKMPYYEKHFSNQYHMTNAVSKLLLRNITTHSFINAPLSPRRQSYPIILFSHGLLGFPSDAYVVILENLASHGYIVAAIDHPYFNGLTLYENGKVVTAHKLSAAFNAMSQREQKEFQSAAIEIYKEDMKFIINQLAKLNENKNANFSSAPNLAGRLDLDRVAAMGHSAGGTASIELCRADERCKAAIDLDGWYDQAIGQEPIHKPLLLMFGQKTIEVSEPTPEYLKRKELTRDGYFEREEKIAEHRKKLCSVPNCSMIIIPDASHGDFGDEIFLKWPLRSWDAVDSYSTMAFINKHIIDFIDSYLKS